MNYKMMIQYEGTRYNGWQKQGNTKNTIQERIETVLSKMADQPVAIHGAGRTDAGVHARGQVANFHLDGSWDTQAIQMYLNRYLPEDIDVITLEAVDERFHSRLQAREKVYAYRIGMDSYKDVFRRREQFHLGESLDVKAMEEAALLLRGEHDFKSFCANRQMKKSTVRYLRKIEFQMDDHALTLIFYGNGFLYNMVRILTGTLIEIGQGKRNAKDIPAILAGQDRQLSGFTAPAKGLTLMDVRYEDV